MENGPELYERCWEILVEHAGASRNPHDHRGFILSCLDNGKYDKLREYRFCGLLGFGGKFWRNDGRLYITCYPEDETPERRGIIEKVNALLAEITPEGGVYGPP